MRLKDRVALVREQIETTSGRLGRCKWPVILPLKTAHFGIEPLSTSARSVRTKLFKFISPPDPPVWLPSIQRRMLALHRHHQPLLSDPELCVCAMVEAVESIPGSTGPCSLATQTRWCRRTLVDNYDASYALSFLLELTYLKLCRFLTHAMTLQTTSTLLRTRHLSSSTLKVGRKGLIPTGWVSHQLSCGAMRKGLSDLSLTAIFGDRTSDENSGRGMRPPSTINRFSPSRHNPQAPSSVGSPITHHQSPPTAFHSEWCWPASHFHASF